MRKNDGRQVMLIVQEVTAMKVSDRNFVFTPKGQSATKENGTKMLVSCGYPSENNYLWSLSATTFLHLSMKLLCV